MKIALIGYGKMGQAIETIATAQGHEIILKINADTLKDLTVENIKQADVAIEFTNPHSAFENICFCLKNAIPVVSGSTGWLQHLDEAKALAIKYNTAFIYASNFSIGVNLFFAVNKYVAQLMSKHKQYQVSMEEIHHTAKLDAPSGTAVTLAEGIIENTPHKRNWINSPSTKNEELSIISKRIDPAPGTHTVAYTSTIDDIEIKHTAHNRVGFASGALQAALFISNKKGVFTMNNVLGLET